MASFFHPLVPLWRLPLNWRAGKSAAIHSLLESHVPWCMAGYMDEEIQSSLSAEHREECRVCPPPICFSQWLLAVPPFSPGHTICRFWSKDYNYFHQCHIWWVYSIRFNSIRFLSIPLLDGMIVFFSKDGPEAINSIHVLCK